MSRKEICFECGKPSFVSCTQCLNEFEEPKGFCVTCDKMVHNPLSEYSNHKREHLQVPNSILQSPLRKGDSSFNSSSSNAQNQKNYLSSLNPQNNNRSNLQEFKRENLQFFKDLKQSSPSQKEPLLGKREDISMKIDKDQEGGILNNYQKREQQYEFNDSEKLEQDKKSESLHQQGGGDSHNNTSNYRNFLQKKMENCLLAKGQNKDDEKRGEEKKYQSKLLSGIVQREEPFKERDPINRSLNQDLKEKDQLDNFPSQKPQWDSKLNINNEESKEGKRKINHAEDQYKAVEEDITSYFGRGQLDKRENEVLKRISDIKTRMQLEYKSNGQQPSLDKKNQTQKREELFQPSNRGYQQFQPRQEEAELLEESDQVMIGSRQDMKDDYKQNRVSQDRARLLSEGNQERNYFGEKYNQVVKSITQKSRELGQEEIKEQPRNGGELKQKMRVQELESTIQHLRQHMDLMEERSKATIRTVQAELLKEQRRNVEVEKDWRHNLGEMKVQYETEINQLRLQIEAEKAKSQASQRRLEDQQSDLTKKTNLAQETTKKAKDEMAFMKNKMQDNIEETDEKIQKVRKQALEEAEQQIEEARIEFDSRMKDLIDEVAQKTNEIKKREEQILSENQKHFEKDTQLTGVLSQTVSRNKSLESELEKVKMEKEQLREIAVIQEGELEILKREYEKLAEEKNELLETNLNQSKQIEKYKKCIYGNKKDKPESISSLSRVPLSSSNSLKPSLSRISSPSLNQRKNENENKN